MGLGYVRLCVCVISSSCLYNLAPFLCQLEISCVGTSTTVSVHALTHCTTKAHYTDVHCAHRLFLIMSSVY